MRYAKAPWVSEPTVRSVLVYAVRMMTGSCGCCSCNEQDRGAVSVGQPQVQQYGVVLMGTGLCQRVRTGHGDVHLVSVMIEQILQPECNVRIVVDDEDGMSECCRCHHILPNLIEPVIKIEGLTIPTRRPMRSPSGCSLCSSLSALKTETATSASRI